MSPQNPQNEEPAINEGDILCGRYRADYLLDRTETGVIVAATDVLRGEGVAIKMLGSTKEEADLLATRLRREAHMLAQLTSPHVVRVFDVDKHGNAVCLIMELLQGSNLAAFIRKRGPLPIDEAVGLTLQACDALAEAHALGIVHRDIKPQNMFVAQRPDGTPVMKVLDFGVSKQGGGMGLTVTGSALGSPLYTALEQLRDASRVDARADIWSLALVLYFMLCRRNAFDADNPVALMLKIATGTPLSLRERRPDVPPELEAIIFRCVEKNPDMRYPDVAALARALVPFGPGWSEAFLRSIEARMARKPLASLPPAASTPPPSPSPSGPPGAPRPALASAPPVQAHAPPQAQGYGAPNAAPVQAYAPPQAQYHGAPNAAPVQAYAPPQAPQIPGYAPSGAAPAPGHAPPNAFAQGQAPGAPPPVLMSFDSAGEASRRRLKLAIIAVAVLAIVAGGAAIVSWATGV